MTRVRCIVIRSFFAIALVFAFVFPPALAFSTRELRIVMLGLLVRIQSILLVSVLSFGLLRISA